MNAELTPSKENLQTEAKCLNKDDLPKDDNDIPDKKINHIQQKNISMFRLYCHLSNTTEVLLMTIGAIGGIASGVAGPLMSFLFGDSLGDFQNGEVNIDLMEDIVNDMVRRFLYIGIGMFIAEFLNNCFWNLAGLRQIYHMKEKYFTLISNRSKVGSIVTTRMHLRRKFKLILSKLRWGLVRNLVLFFE